MHFNRKRAQYPTPAINRTRRQRPADSVDAARLHGQLPLSSPQLQIWCLGDGVKQDIASTTFWITATFPVWLRRRRQCQGARESGAVVTDESPRGRGRPCAGARDDATASAVAVIRIGSEHVARSGGGAVKTNLGD